MVTLKEWDCIAEQSKMAWFTHLSSWIFLESCWGVENHSFFIRDGEKIVGTCPLFLVSKKGFRYLTSGYKGWGGPAFIDNAPPETITGAYKYINECAKQLKADWIEIKFPSIIQSMPPLEDYGYNCIQGKTSIIDLTKSEEELLANIDKKCRYEIRKSEKLNLNVKFTEAESLDDIKEYHKMHCENYARTGTLSNPLWYFYGLFSLFNIFNIVKFFFVELDGKKVSAASVAIWKDRAIYLTGASLDEALGKGLNNYLQWNIIRYLHNQGVSWYEMGEIEEENEKAKNLGKFKESFGGQPFPIFKGMKVCRPFRYKLYCFLKRVKKWF
jgi:lipid II:glycine glycyltransferase (peptidoglycan interpeptide bridge formation enzyme)